MKFNCSIPGVILNDYELSLKKIKEYVEQGYLVLSTSDEIEVEDSETGELYKGNIIIENDDFMLFDVIDKSGKIIHEEELLITDYLLQLKENGELDCYPKVEF